MLSVIVIKKKNTLVRITRGIERGMEGGNNGNAEVYAGINTPSCLGTGVLLNDEGLFS